MISNLKQGSKYSVETKDEVLEGVYVNSDKDFIYLKQDSGYNLGVSRKKVKNFTLLKEKKEKKQKSKKQGKGEIVILHTGGTIASRVDYSTGAVSNSFTPEELLEMFPELEDIASIESELVFNKSSEDLDFKDYNEIAKVIDKHVKRSGVRGIILTHGTDTMHFTASALSFALEGLTKPVVLVGSQRSSDRPSSDASLNLFNAAFFAKQQAPGVFICMHENVNDEACLIHSGLNARKMHSSRRDAFESINRKAVARVDYSKDKVEWIEKPEEQQEEYSLKLFDEKISVGWLKSRPGLKAEEVAFYDKYDALLLEGTGLGHFPLKDDNEKVYKNLKAIAKNNPVAMTTQTLKGRVNLNVYSHGRALKDIGVIGHNLDMTPETAYVKLNWLLSNYKDRVKELYSENLRGELSERSDL